MDLPARAVVLGATSGGGDLALALVRAGVVCDMVEPDVFAAERMMHALSRQGGALPGLRGDMAALSGADLVLIGGDAAGLADRIAAPLEAGSVVAFAGPPLAVAHPGRSMVLHLFAPFDQRRLAEVICLPETDPATAHRLGAWMEALGRVPVVLPSGTASPAWRLLNRLHAVIEALALRGAVPWELDEALVADGFTIGPCEAQDLMGVDLALSQRPVGTVNPIVPRMVAEGRLGKKGSVGWYRYPGGGGAVIDPLIEDLIAEEAWFGRVPRGQIPTAEICALVHAGLIGEAVALIGEGCDPQAVARVARHALGLAPGFADLAARARAIGARTLLDDLDRLAEFGPDCVPPLDRLRACAATGADPSAPPQD